LLLQNEKDNFKKNQKYEVLSYQFLFHEDTKDSYSYRIPFQGNKNKEFSYTNNYNIHKGNFIDMGWSIPITYYRNITDTDIEQNPDRKYFDWQIIHFDHLRKKGRSRIEAWIHNKYTKIEPKNYQLVYEFDIDDEIIDEKEKEISEKEKEISEKEKEIDEKEKEIHETEKKECFDDQKDIFCHKISQKFNRSHQNKKLFDWMGMNEKILSRPVSIESWFFPEFVSLYNVYKRKPWTIPINLLFHDFENFSVNEEKNENPSVNEEKNEKASVNEEKNEKAIVKGKKNEKAIVKGKKNEKAIVKGKKNEKASVKGKKNEKASVKGKKNEKASVKGKKNEKASVKGKKNEKASVKGKKNEKASVNEEKIEDPIDPVTLNKQINSGHQSYISFVQKYFGKKENNISIHEDFLDAEKKFVSYQMDWNRFVEDPDVLSNIDLGVLMLQLKEHKIQKSFAITFLKKGDLHLDLMMESGFTPMNTLLEEGAFFIEPIRLSKMDVQFYLYQTIGISWVHKSKKRQNNQKRSRDKNNYDLLIPENILSPRRRRELRILICFNSRNNKGVDKNPVYCNGNRVNKGSQFFDKSKDLDRDKKKLIKFFLWPNYRLEDLACMNRYWFDTNNGSRFSILRIRMYPRLKR